MSFETSLRSLLVETNQINGEKSERKMVYYINSLSAGSFMTCIVELLEREERLDTETIQIQNLIKKS